MPEPQVEPQNEPKADTTDWKAEAKKWEAYARTNLDKAKAYDAQAKELEALKAQVEGSKTVEQKLAELTSKFEASQTENTRLKVAAEKGVPAELLNGGTEDEMRAYADSLLQYAQQVKPSAAPVVGTDGNVPSAAPQKSKEDSFFEFFNNQLH